MPRSEDPAESPGAADTGAITGEPDADGRRERRRREVRDGLFEAAVALFLEQGYDRTTMDEIATRAGVARATVFNHFPRKAEFINEWGARRRDAVAVALRERRLDRKPIGTVLDSYMHLMAQLNEAHRAESRELMPAAVTLNNVLNHPPLAGALAAYIRRAQKRGEVRAGVDPARSGLLLAAGYFATLVEWCDDDPEPFDLSEALSGVTRIVLHGIEPGD